MAGNGSYQPPGAPQTLQAPGRKPKTNVLEPNIVYKIRKKPFQFLINPFKGPYKGGELFRSPPVCFIRLFCFGRRKASAVLGHGSSDEPPGAFQTYQDPQISG